MSVGLVKNSARPTTLDISFEVPIPQQYNYSFKTVLNMYKLNYVSVWFSLHESRRNFSPIFAKDISPFNKIVNKKSMMLSFFHGLRPTAKLRESSFLTGVSTNYFLHFVWGPHSQIIQFIFSKCYMYVEIRFVTYVCVWVSNTKAGAISELGHHLIRLKITNP